jgi:hypothetical protein
MIAEIIAGSRKAQDSGSFALFEIRSAATKDTNAKTANAYPQTR